MTVTGRSDLVRVEVRMHHRTDNALLVSLDGDRDKAVWIPLSQCEIEERPGGIVVLEMPEWLAIDRGLENG
jgi:hypothetical protein